MASYETDYYVWDKDYNSSRSIWSPAYLHKFTSLLRDNTVLLQRLQGYPRDDPLQELKRRALEEARVTLGLDTVEQVRARITTFRAYASGKFRSCASRLGPGCSPEAILRRVPKWLRDLEPHLNLWKMDERKSVGPVLSPPEDAGGRLARALAARARALRTLEARVVANRVGGVHQNKQDELRFIWWRMLDVVRQKLSLLCAGGSQDEGGSGGGGGGVRLTGAEPLLAELVLLYDESINTLPDADDTETMQALVGLFHVAQEFRLEEEPTAAAWRRAHLAYITEHHKIKGFGASRLLMQRRWYELKLAARRALLRYARDPTPPPCPLHASIAKRFPHVVTGPWRSWRDLVDSSACVEAHEDWTSEDADSVSMPACEYKACESFSRFSREHTLSELAARASGCHRALSELAVQTRAYRGPRSHNRKHIATNIVAQLTPASVTRGHPYPRSVDVAADDPDREGEGEGEDDLIVVEREIETIDLEEDTEPTDTVDDRLQEQLRSQSQDFAEELEKDLERQLAQLQPGERSEGVEPSESDLFSSEPSGPPTFIYDSDDDDMDDEDRQKNMALIASHICSEINDQRARGDDDGDDASGDGDEENGTIDEKLLMDARVQLRRVDASAQWRRAAAAGTISVSRLLHTYPPRKRPRTGDTTTREEVDTETAAPVQVKQEKIDEDPSQVRGERQVKTMARRLIAEMMRDTDSEPTRKNNVAKKVQLPDIEQVRMNNRALLTAQVAPLSPSLHHTQTPATDGDAPSPAEAGSLSRDQLDRLLTQLTLQRSTSTTKYCCPAREQHLAHSAWRRAGACALDKRTSTSTCRSCSRAGAPCSCCCWYLLSRAHAHDGEARARLQRESGALAAALTDLASEHAQIVFSDKAKKRPYREKKQGVTLPAPPFSDPLQEWIRQKNLNQQYFNLNLKTPKPTAPTKTPTSTPPLTTAPTKTTTSTPPVTTAPTKTPTSTPPVTTAPTNTTLTPPIPTAPIKTDDQTSPSTSKFLTIVPLPRPSTAPSRADAPAPPPTHSNIFAVSSATALTKRFAPAPPPEFRKFLLIPTDNSDPQVKSKIVFANNKTLQPVGVSAPPKIINFATSLLDNKPFQDDLITIVDETPSRPPLPPRPPVLAKHRPKTHAKLYTTTLKKPNAANKMAQNAKVKTNKHSVKVVVADSRALPGNRLVRIAPAPPACPPAAPAAPTAAPGGVTETQHLRGTGMEVTKISAAGSLGAVGVAGSEGAGRSLLKQTLTGGSKIDLSTSSVMNKQLVKMCVDQKMISGFSNQKVISKPNNQKLISASNDQKVISKPSDQKLINASNDQKVISKPNDQKLTSASNDQKVISKPNDQKLISVSNDQKVISKPSDKNMVSLLSDQKLIRLTDGAVLTKLTPENKSNSAASADADQQTISISRHLRSPEGTVLSLQVMDGTLPPLMVGARSHLVTERALHASQPAYWTLATPHRRLVADSCVLFPPLEVMHNKHHLRLRDQPRLYAQVYWVVHTIAQCLSELSSGASLFVTSPRGSLTPLSRGAHGQLICDDNEATLALSELLWERGSKVRSNERAAAVIALNNIRRRPLELVQLSDDDQEEEKQLKQEAEPPVLHAGGVLQPDKFNGLERFEEMDEFDL